MSPGLVGISLTADWGEPVDLTNQRDIEAAERYIQFYMGWFATPLFNGDYPQVMKEYIGTLRSDPVPVHAAVVKRAGALLQAGRAASRGSEPLGYPCSHLRRRVTLREPATSWAWATSPLATSPKRITHQALGTAILRIVTLLSSLTRSGLIPALNGSTLFPGASGAC